MAKGVPHYFKDGTQHTGGTHKMPDGTVHSGASHRASSKKLFHLDELSKTAREKAMRTTKPKKKAPPKRPAAGSNRRSKPKKVY